MRVDQLEAQNRELGIARTYETALLARDDRLHITSLSTATSGDATVARLSALLRAAMRASQGEDDPSAPAAASPRDESTSRSASSLSSSSFGFGDDDEPPDDARSRADHALERECELARLERENAELRRMLGHPVPDFPYAPAPPPRAPPPQMPRRFPSLRTSGLGVYNPFPGSGGAMGIGMVQSPGGVDFSPEGLWREQERAREGREALLS